MKIAFKFLTILLIVSILGVGVFFLLKHTDNFSSDLKTFYVEYENHHLATESDTVYCQRATYRFDIVYPFNFLNKEQKGYSVKVVPNVKAETAEYVIDGNFYSFTEIRDVTKAFNIRCEETYFTLSIPKDFTIKNVLETIYPDKTIEIDDEYLTSDEPFYTLIITSYDGSKQCNINFGIVDGLVKDVTLDITRIEF